jgi:hypothetical protein
MSDLIFTIKKDNTRPSLKRQLQDGEGNPIDLTGATVRFFMRGKGSNLLVAGLPCTVLQDGWVQYDWRIEDTAVSGFHRAEFQVEYSPGQFETFPNKGYLQIEVEEDLDPT